MDNEKINERIQNRFINYNKKIAFLRSSAVSKSYVFLIILIISDIDY